MSLGAALRRTLNVYRSPAPVARDQRSQYCRGVSEITPARR